MKKSRERKGTTGLFPKAREKALSVLFLDPDERWHLRNLARKMGMAVRTVQREVERLTAADVLTRERDGNRVYYRANIRCPYFPELRGLILKTSGLVDVLRRAVAPVRDKITLAFVFGSVAGGGERATSDIDVMLIGAIEFSEAVQALHRAQEELGREVNPIVYDVEEIKRRLSEGNAFMRDVWKSPKLYLIGGEDELRALAGE